ncbi:MAG: hypothetical protein MJ102_02735 [Clostridia bacterium]|nr:hypothetical protein [Clostridia bacterium]
MKRIIIAAAAGILLCSLLFLISCGSKNTQSDSAGQILVTPNAPDEESFIMSKKDSLNVKDIIKDQEVISDLSNCGWDYLIEIDGVEYHYHSECGTFNDYDHKLSFTVSDGQQETINAILAANPKINGRKPFAVICAADIESASVTLEPPGVTVEVKDIEKLAELLKSVVIYKDKGSEWREYDGQSVCFNIRKADGTEIEVRPFMPFFVIDGVGCTCDYDSCNALTAFANGIMG